MINIKGELWDGIGKVDAICITTNGFVKKNGEAVMGRGCALEATKRYPEIQLILGKHLKRHLNHVGILLTDNNTAIYAYPVKHNWYEEADIELIRRSAYEMVVEANNYDYKTILIPRPGCGNGKLKWEDVEPVISPILDNRFFIVTH